MTDESNPEQDLVFIEADFENSKAARLIAKHRWDSAKGKLHMALVQAVASGIVPIQSIEANTVFLGQQARALKSAIQYPGVRAVEK